MTTAYSALTRTLLRFDLRDWSTFIFTFIFPAGLLIVLALTIGESTPGLDLVSPISANVIAFGAAFVGIYAGATHLALWRENGMITVMRNFPISSNTVLGAQATAGTILLLAQALLLFIVGIVLGMHPQWTAPLALVPVIIGYLLFFSLGTILGILVPSMAGVSMAATVIVIPLGMVGGAMMPMEMMPDWVQALAPFTPIYHMREAISMPLIGEGSWQAMLIGLLYLTGVAAVLMLLAQRFMRWK